MQYTRLTGTNDGNTVRYHRNTGVLQTLSQVRRDGSLTTTPYSLDKCSLRVLNDWVRDSISIRDAQNIHEVLDASFGHTATLLATLLATQVPIPEWHRAFQIPPAQMPSSTGWCSTFIVLT